MHILKILSQVKIPIDPQRRRTLNLPEGGGEGGRGKVIGEGKGEGRGGERGMEGGYIV